MTGRPATPDYPATPPGWAMEMTEDGGWEPTMVADQGQWTRGKARAYMAAVRDVPFTDVRLIRLPLVWDPNAAAQRYREDECSCGAGAEDDCTCPWPSLQTFWTESGTYCPWREPHDGDDDIQIFWVGEAP